MLKANDPLSRLKIASPCPVGWEQMKGDDRARFCDHCDLHVYNISELTTRQAVALIEKTEGRLCARLYRRTDGSVLTRDCPVGVRAIRKRVARIAGATATAVLSFCFGVMGQKRSQEEQACSGALQITVERKGKEHIQPGAPKLVGVVKDQNDAVIPGASVEITGADQKKLITVETNDEGIFRIGSLETGTYSIKVHSPGFAEAVIKEISINTDEILSMNITLKVDAEGVVLIGVVGEDPMLDSGIGNRTTVEPKKITRLPF